MTVLLDTSVLIGLEERRLLPERVPDQASISCVTLEELYLGVLLAAPDAVGTRTQTYRQAARGFPVLDVTPDVARTCAEIRAEGRRRRVRYEPYDSLIGATARVHALPLYTQDAGTLGMAGVDVRVV